jgi:hypothetical protein
MALTSKYRPLATFLLSNCWRSLPGNGTTSDSGLTTASLSGHKMRLFDTARCCGRDRPMRERVEAAVRTAVMPGTRLRTPTGRGQFSVTLYTTDGLVLLLGAKEAWTPLPWKALEEVPDFLRGRGWVAIAGAYSTERAHGTLDAHFKEYIKRATVGWLAVVLEAAGVLQIDRSRPTRVRLASGW